MRGRRWMRVVGGGLVCGTVGAWLFRDEAPPPAPAVEVAQAEKPPEKPPNPVVLAPMFGLADTHAELAPEPAPKAAPEVPCPPKLVVRAAFVATRPQASSALVFDGTVVRTVWVDTDVDGWRVREIRRDPLEVDITQRATLCTVTEGTTPASPKTAAAPRAEVRDESTVRVDKRMLGNMESLVRDVTMLPAFQNGASIGFRVGWIRQGSPLQLLGVKAGDVVTGVGGKALNGPGAALEAWQRITAGERSMEVDIDRAGEHLVRRFELE